ncbi:hypothetical protein [uncultured Thiothrix sp.]|uniref:hypothetical protein n=1 Tax=uncultured Thiothrix sp. TaxID=223185 RepID=UPI002613A101|nr:hypothetical protein [uncultured Thiothrix sp.]
MNSYLSQYKMLLIWGLVFILTPLSIDDAVAHVKWFVDVDVEDALQPLGSHPARQYMPILFILASCGTILFGIFDYFFSRLLPEQWTPENYFFEKNTNTPLTIARIGTGVYCLVLWLMGDSILTPELTYQKADWVAYLQLFIAFSVLFKLSLSFSGFGLITLYFYAIYKYGIFHCLDYFFVFGLGIYLIISGLDIRQKIIADKHYALLYFSLVFAFLWSAIEKLAYPDAFYQFLAKYPLLMMGLDRDFFIISAAFVEFSLFFLLLFSHKGIILLALLVNLLISAGGLYFGKMDAIGHWPVNFILAMMFLKGPLPVNKFFFNQCLPKNFINLKNLITLYCTMALLVVFYYGLHDVMYGGVI